MRYFLWGSYYGLMGLNLFTFLITITVFIFDCQSVPNLDSRNPFELAPVSFLTFLLTIRLGGLSGTG